ncbi:2,3,4,5-tetrahydropyridine-2,6-carboxylate N-succinyltransferase [Hydrogenimonas urashimensis]|uniref:2,3,4,5-tetrahydropyridine-2,6-carboxylate N-succinyltransferase n=1 Tax=Hydrogenimonas urashimensis TaxID=2740515 RepID=UPI00191609FF|nr:2,3,4,5-tetrahydropyridine-2,6-carboxylate N-succinyltransferase [Hydrogenimonas urashimensis]
MAIEQIESKEAFKSFVENTEGQEGYRRPVAFGICRVDRGQKNHDKILQAVYPLINWNENYGSAAVFAAALQESGETIDFGATEQVFTVSDAFIINAINIFAPYIAEAKGEAHKNVQVIANLAGIAEAEMLEDNYRVVFLFEDAAPKSVEAVYLKLYALSLGKAALRSVNLNGAFGILHNCAWFGNEPFELEWLRDNEIDLKLNGAYPEIESVDKFPRYLQHIIPADNTRILDSAKVRMGAQLAPGTTVMPGASYINFNAGTTGAVMVEGRISSSAIVGPGSDVGGGASILGVLSGTNGNPVTIGENVLLGANSVTGIPLGDGCIVDAGIAVLEGTKFVISGAELEKIKEVNPEWDVPVEEENIFKGVELAGKNGIHFRQESTTGRMIAMRSRREVKLNEELH